MQKNIKELSKLLLSIFHSKHRYLPPHFSDSINAHANKINDQKTLIHNTLVQLIEEKNFPERFNKLMDLERLFFNISNDYADLSQILIHVLHVLDTQPNVDIEADSNTYECAQVIKTQKFNKTVPSLFSFGNSLIFIENGYLIVRDFDLTIKQSIYLFDNPLINHIFYKFSGDQLIVVCEEIASDNYFLLHVNLENSSYYVIKDEKLKHISPIYWWAHDEIIITTYDKTLYSINLENKLVTHIFFDYKKDLYKMFYSFFQDVIQFQLSTIQCEKLSFTFLNKEHQGGYVNFIESVTEKINYHTQDVFKLSFAYSHWLLLGEEKIIFQSPSGLQCVIHASGEYYFVNAFLCPSNPNKAVVHSVSRKHSGESWVVIYELTPQ